MWIWLTVTPRCKVRMLLVVHRCLGCWVDIFTHNCQMWKLLGGHGKARCTVIQAKKKGGNCDLIAQYNHPCYIQKIRHLVPGCRGSIDSMSVLVPGKTLPSILLPPQGFGPEAKTQGGTLGFPTCIHTRIKKICWKSKKCVCSGRSILDLTKLGAHGCLG